MKNLFASSIAFVVIAVFSNNVGARDSLNTEIILNYADIAQAVYTDSLNEAIKLRSEIRKLIHEPSEEQLFKTRQAWLLARVPYSQSEVFRFGNSIVDEWEGKVNAWPLDEGLIDYVVNDLMSSDNVFSNANVIKNTEINDGDNAIKTLKISQGLLKVLHSLGDIETNVATGYHAIEFLLWGQDLNHTNPGSGRRPYTDFDRKKCTNGNCFRRNAYIKAAADLLVKELTWITKQWEPYTDEKYSYINGGDFDVFDVGLARKALLDMNESQALTAIIVGMGSMAYGELAGERTKLALILNDPEEEQDCFSDNTHNSHYYNLKGIRNVFYGAYKRTDGSVLSGASLANAVQQLDESMFTRMARYFDQSHKKARVIVDLAQKEGVHFDQLISAQNSKGAAVLNDLIDSLLQLTNSFTDMAFLLGLDDVVFEGSDAFKQQKNDVFFE